MNDKPASKQIDDIITALGSWKGDLLSQLRSVITKADPGVVEEIKWRMKTRPEGLPVWTHDGIVCFAEIWKDNIKLLFPKGAELKDTNTLFNARLKSKDLRAIEFHDGDTISENALQALVHEAVQHNSTLSIR